MCGPGMSYREIARRINAEEGTHLAATTIRTIERRALDKILVELLARGLGRGDRQIHPLPIRVPDDDDDGFV